MVYTRRMARVDWKFDDLLARHGLTPADVEREIIRRGYKWGTKTVYRFSGEGPSLISRDSTLPAIIDALRSLTGKQVSVCDLLEYVEE